MNIADYTFICLLKKAVFWDVAPCRYCVNRCFGGTYLLNLQGITQEEIRERTSVSRYNRLLRYVPPKRRLTQYLHGATSQNTAFFIVTAVKTSNLTYIFNVLQHGVHAANSGEHGPSWKAIVTQPKGRISALFVESHDSLPSSRDHTTKHARTLRLHIPYKSHSPFYR
jgi:hypothetical protein